MGDCCILVYLIKLNSCNEVHGFIAGKVKMCPVHSADSRLNLVYDFAERIDAEIATLFSKSYKILAKYNEMLINAVS